MYKSFDLVNKLVYISSITNKWLMWSESKLPDQSVYVPSIFQMRDAFSHLMVMFGEGIDRNDFRADNDELKLFYANKDTQHQLNEAVSHVSRSFFDCADHILLSIKEELNRNSLSAFWILKDLDKYTEKIIKLRNSKSDNIEVRYQNVILWDKVLQVVTTIYSIGYLEIHTNSNYTVLKELIHQIETDHEKDTIVSYCSDFYSRIKMEAERMSMMNVYDLLGQDLIGIDDLEEIVIEDVVGWHDNALAELNDRSQKAEKLINEVKTLHRAMISTSLIEKNKKQKSTLGHFYKGAINAVISFVITSFLGEWLINPSTTANTAAQQAGQMLPVKNLALYATLFIIIITIVYIIPIGINSLIKFIYKKRS